MRRIRGFTLIELLVVIAIVALLMAILMPALSRAREQGKRVQCSANLKSIGVGLILYAEAYDAKLPANLDPDHPYTAYRGDKDYGYGRGVPQPAKLGLLHFTNIIPDGKTFYCPSGLIDWLKYKNYNNPAPWGTLPQNYNTELDMNNWVRTGFSYYPQGKKRDEKGFPKLAMSYLDLSPNKTVVTDAIWQKSKLSHVSGGRLTGLNGLFGDGHVNFSVTEAAFSDELWGTADAEVRPGTIQFQTILDLLEP